MPYNPKVGDPISSLDTPSMLVSLPLMERNIATLFALLSPTGVSIRPHLKTTKCVALAKRLVAAGATGGCCAKLSEAEVLCEKGFSDLLVTCEVIGDVKVGRLVELWSAHRGVKVVVDCVEGAAAINDKIGQMSGGGDARMDVLVDLDVGLHRTGVKPQGAVELARAIKTMPHLRLIGVQGYEGHLQHVHGLEERKKMCLESMQILTSTADALRADGHDIRVVTTGGTGTAEFCASVKGVTEVQPGSFLFMDTDYRNALGDKNYSNSLTILSTVLSVQGPRIVTIDAGLKSLTTDSGLAECKTPGYTYGVLGDEHGSLKWEEGREDLKLKVGDRVEMVPSHIDPTINLHDTYYAHRDGVIEEIWTVDARGKVQ